MQREVDFEIFLIKHRKSYKHTPSGARIYVRICKRIERILGGRDMDDLVASKTEIEATEKVLEANGSFTDTRAAFRAYCEFAEFTKTATLPAHSTKSVPLGTSFNSGGLVVYENSVPSIQRVPGLCAFLEKEYDKIRRFAQKILDDINLNVPLDFPTIPVYLSKEQPKKRYPLDPSEILQKIERICAECKGECGNPPRCPAFSAIFETESIEDAIVGRFYSEEPHIVLYFRNFSRVPAMSDSCYLGSIAQTLAHEYLHFLHYRYVKIIVKKKTNPFYDEELSEALADYFGVLYSLCNANVSVAEDRYDLWIKRKHTIWPYWNAIRFFDKPYKPQITQYTSNEIDESIKKFKEVFQNTPNIKTAKRILRHKIDFYA